MKLSHLTIENFRGIKTASLFLPDHVVLIGDNNTGKSTVFEAIDLVLALQLPFPKISESMGNHDSKIVDAGSVD